MPHIAAIQMSSSSALGMNLIALRKHVANAASQGAKLIVLPDRFALFSPESNDYAANKEILTEGRIQLYLQKLCLSYNVWIIASGVPLYCEYDAKQFYLATLVFDNKAELIDVYYHLKPQIPLTGHARSLVFEDQSFGSKVVIIQTPFGKVGLASNYDLLVPEYFRYMSAQGAQIFAVSAAISSDFADYWMMVLKTRALENSAYMVVANQCGYHEDMARLNHGNSMILDASANLLAHCDVGESVLMSHIDCELHTKMSFDYNPFQLQYRRK